MKALAALAVSLSVLLSSALSTALAQEPLGLADRRGIKTYQDNVFPAQLAAIRQSAGYDVAVDVAWEAIVVKDQGNRFSEPEFWTNIYFVPLAQALSKIASDDLGKEALKAKVKTIRITHERKTAPASNYINGLSLADGVLTVNFTPYSNTGDVDERRDAIVKFLESKL